MNIFKKISLLFTLTLVMCLSFVTVSASPTQKVYDLDGSLTIDEISKLDEEAYNLTQELGFDVVVVITDDIGHKSAEAFADDYFDYNGFGIGEDYDGILLLVNNDTYVDYISTCGNSINIFTDARINSMLNSAGPHFKNGDFYYGILSFLNDVDYYNQLGVPKNQYTYSYSSALSQNIIIGLFLGLIISAVMILSVINKYKLKYKPSASAYLKGNGLNFTVMQDNYIRTHVSRRYSPQESSSGGSSSGRSSTHRSSSGRSHGGGGRRR